ncbi:Leucine-rich repeat-containing G-protein coupled receptor 6 [Wickerhamomyces ciferrii]|uniref:Leucine-rich repeat-containing G-protein coupled receptor 6 n=1 Tax=Wickerhamomyces ciferrii (strain ATCC 14091 / BCRC 22168 / CBS 111 / JCM 3599 / NBRC 0793 / NRRL Y-1031 F-60-10) TaxID=1206466 RepID=K0K8J7_WICCF|nr:Leucine-rich repeat-containing G-protein coupled receptor 6 [Wickerhamomyces ciferrii]CCH41165.1 Leucine-rich repeat-containing G-protein coupled receptor 6 [Wickerhamomyces ciferrii]
MKSFEFPPEIQILVLQHSSPSDLLNILQHIPELKPLITSDIFRIVSNDLPKVKLKYGLPDDFYLDYKCNIDENVDYDTYYKLIRDYYERERNNKILDPSLIRSFKGAILIELYEQKAYSLTKFDDHLLQHDPIEVVWHTSTKINKFRFFNDLFQSSANITRLNKLQILIETENELNNESDIEQFELLNLPHRIPPNKLHIPFVKSLHFGLDEVRGIRGLKSYSITDIQTIMPNLESINLVFDDESHEEYHWYLKKKGYISTTILGFLEDLGESSWNEKSILDEFFQSSIGAPLDFLKAFQLKYFHNKKFKLFDNSQVSNLEKLIIDSSTIQSIKNLNLPNLKQLSIKKSAIYEISNLNFNSLLDLSIKLSAPHSSLENKQYLGNIHPIIHNIKSSSLKKFNLVTSFKIKKISELDFPSLERMSIKSTNNSNKYFDITNSPFPQLENITIEKIPLENLYYSLFQNNSNLKTINISSCPTFNIKEMGSQNSLNSLTLRNMKSIQGLNGISLPMLTNLDIQTVGKIHLSIEDCSFKNLKTMIIDTYLFFPTYDATLSFLNNDIPQLRKLFISGYELTNHFSAEPYPFLEELTIDRTKSIAISLSNTLETLNISESDSKMRFI